MKHVVAVVLFLAVTMPIVYLLGPRPSVSEMMHNVTLAKAAPSLPPGPGYHASSPIAGALARHPNFSVLLFCAFAVGTIVLAYGLGVLVYKVIGPVRARPARRVL